MAATSEAMNQFDESMKKQIAVILKVVLLNKSLKEDNIPCEIDEVVSCYCFNLINCILFVIMIILMDIVKKDEFYFF